MKFCLDNNLSQQLAKGMKGFGEDVVHLTEFLLPEVEDAEFLAYIGSKGWYLVTRDHKIRYRPAESAALRKHQVGAFFMSGKNLGRCQLTQQIVRNWPKMKELAKKTKRPFAFRVPPNGKMLNRFPSARTDTPPTLCPPTCPNAASRLQPRVLRRSRPV